MSFGNRLDGYWRDDAWSKTGASGGRLTVRCFKCAAVSLLLIAIPALTRGGFVESDGWQIGWDDTMGVARRAGHPSAEVILYEQPEQSDGCDYNELSGRVLSVVGSLVSFETTRGWYCQGNAHPGKSARFHAVDLDTGAEVDIRSLVEDASIVAALKQDGLVSKALNGCDPEDLESLVEQADGGCAVSFPRLATSFAFYEPRDDKVAVRFGLGHGCEVMRGALSEIEVELPFPIGLDVEGADAKGQLMNSLAPGRVRR